MSKISQYANSVAALGTDDLFDVSEKISSSPDVYESRKMTGAVLATFIQSYTSNILNTNSLTLGGNYTHDLAGNQLVFDGGNFGVVGEIGVTADDISRTNVFVAGDYLGQSILAVKNAGNVGVGTLTPDASAVLDASSTDSGFLVPRMTTAQKNAITTPAESLIVYDTDTNRHEFYNSAGSWSGLGSSLYNTNDTIGTGRVATLTDTLKIDSSGAPAGGAPLLLGNLFTGAATNGVIQFQNTGADTDILANYTSSSVNSGGKKFVIGTASGNYPTVGGGSHLILSTSVVYSSTANRIWIQGSSREILFQANGRTYCKFDENGEMYINPSSTAGVSIGGTNPDNSAKLDVSSTTMGFLPPRMTTTQKNAITTPATGLVVFDSTLAKLCVYTGAAWETVTSA